MKGSTTKSLGGRGDYEDQLDEDDDSHSATAKLMRTDTMLDDVDRRCTDIWCALAFCVGVACFAYLMAYSFANGDISKLESFKDGSGKRCSFGSPTSLLYFCQNKSSRLPEQDVLGTTAILHREAEGDGSESPVQGALQGGPVTEPEGLEAWARRLSELGPGLEEEGTQVLTFDFDRPICVAACPSGNGTFPAACGDNLDYDSVQHLGMLCLPRGVPASGSARQKLRDWTAISDETVLIKILIQRWDHLFFVAGVAVLCSVLMLGVLQKHTRGLVTSGLVLLAVVPTCAGLYLLGHLGWMGLDPPPSPFNLPGGVGTLVLGFLFTCIGITLSHKIEIAIVCIEMALTCINSTPMFTVHPIVIVVSYMGALSMGAAGILSLLSCGEERLSSRERVFYDLNKEQTVYLGCLLLLLTLLLQVVFAISEFVVGYMTTVWYFHGASAGRRVPKCCIWQAYWVMMRYHFGSMVLGGFLVSSTRPLRFLLGGMGCCQGNLNPVSILLRAFCCCLGDVFRDYVAPLDKSAFIDIVITGRSFCQAAHHARQVVEEEADTVRILNGATGFIQLIGTAATAWLGADAMILVSRYYVGDDSSVTLAMAITGAIVAFYVSIPFSLVFDTVSDTIFYCNEVELRMMATVESKVSSSGFVSRVCPCIMRPSADRRMSSVEQWSQAGVGHEGSTRDVPRAVAESPHQGGRSVGIAGGGRGGGGGGKGAGKGLGHRLGKGG